MYMLHNQETDLFCRALLQLRTMDECYQFLEDVCTIKEIQEISQRLAVAAALSEGKNYGAVSAETGASTATISRVNRCLQYGSEGYRTVLDRLNAEEGANGNPQ